MRCSRLRLVICAAITLIAAGCGGSSSNTNRTERAPPTPTTTASLLAAGSVCIDPRIDEPTSAESQVMGFRDVAALQQVPTTPTWTAWMDAAATRVGICPDVSRYVLNDMLGSIGSGGGWALDNWYAVDGKFLDVLWDWAAYRALREAGLIATDVIAAADQIVAHYNALPSTTGGGQVFTVTGQPASVTNRAAQIWEGLAGYITFHEYAHLWARHSLLRYRVETGALPGSATAGTTQEDEADTQAGMLLATAGYDTTYSLDAVDLLAFYAFHWVGAVSSFNEVLSPQFQNAPTSPTHSSPARRKSLVSAGIAAMRQHLGLPKPSFHADPAAGIEISAARLAQILRPARIAAPCGCR